MKIVLDTNVIIAAFASRGLCAELLEECLKNYEIILSEYILSEVIQKLITKICIPSRVAQEISNFLKEHATIVTPEDLPIIGTALAGKAQFLITGDKELLKLKMYRTVEIISPRKFWEKYIIKSG